MTIRSTYIFGFVTISVLLLISLYLQFFEGIMPCPLCTLQRLSFGLLGIWFLIGILLNTKRKGRVLINFLCGITSMLGIFLAGRQVWLQHFPSPDNTECGVSIQYMMQVLPMNQVLEKIFAGSTECTLRGWEFLHINMAEWALIWFIGFFILTLCLFCEELHWNKNK